MLRAIVSPVPLCLPNSGLPLCLPDLYHCVSHLPLCLPNLYQCVAARPMCLPNRTIVSPHNQCVSPTVPLCRPLSSPKYLKYLHLPLASGSGMFRLRKLRTHTDTPQTSYLLANIIIYENHTQSSRTTSAFFGLGFGFDLGRAGLG